MSFDECDWCLEYKDIRYYVNRTISAKIVNVEEETESFEESSWQVKFCSSRCMDAYLHYP